MVLLLLICCLVCFPLVVWVLCLFCCAFVSILVLQSSWRGRACCFAFIVLRMTCYCKCSVTLPHGTVGWSVMCDCGISWSYTYLFLMLKDNTTCHCSPSDKQVRWYVPAMDFKCSLLQNEVLLPCLPSRLSGTLEILKVFILCGDDSHFSHVIIIMFSDQKVFPYHMKLVFNQTSGFRYIWICWQSDLGNFGILIYSSPLSLWLWWSKSCHYK